MARLTTLKPRIATLETRRVMPAIVGETQRTRGRAWMRTRQRILLRDGGMCQCEDCAGLRLLADEVDHIVPLWEGGADTDANLQAIAADCHKAKTVREAARRAGGGSNLQGSSDRKPHPIPFADFFTP